MNYIYENKNEINYNYIITNIKKKIIYNIYI